mgnify:CR=1 FL=1
MLRAELRDAGCEVVFAADGNAGLQAVGGTCPDIILVDADMPDGRGIGAIRALRGDAATVEVPIIVLSKQADLAEVVARLEHGADEYITKPIYPGELRARMALVRKRASARQGLAAVNDQLVREVSEKTRRLGVLYRFARRINEMDSQDGILDLTIEAVQEAAKARRISILLPEGDGRRLRCARAVGLPPEVASDVRVDIDGSISGTVFRTRKTTVANARAEADHRGGRYATDVFLSAPLVSTTLQTQGEVIGVLNVTDKLDDLPFASEEVDCICSIADMAAVALNNQLRRSRIESFVQVLLLTIGRLAEYRDDETAAHLDRVQRYAGLLARRLRSRPAFRAVLTDDFIRDLVLSTPLHDIGKIGIPDEILLKKGPLTPKEFAVMRTHVEIGRQTLEFAVARTGSMPLLQMCIDIVYGHHEKWDGSGYPEGRRADEIPLAARIVALADVYDAITSQRPYKPPQPHERALDVIRKETGRHFDPAVVKAFLDCADEFDRIRRDNSDELAEPDPVAAFA